HQMDLVHQEEFPAVLTHKLSCDKTVIGQMKEYTLGNSASRLCFSLMEQHTRELKFPIIFCSAVIHRGPLAPKLFAVLAASTSATTTCAASTGTSTSAPPTSAAATSAPSTSAAATSAAATSVPSTSVATTAPTVPRSIAWQRKIREKNLLRALEESGRILKSQKLHCHSRYRGGALLLPGRGPFGGGLAGGTIIARTPDRLKPPSLPHILLHDPYASLSQGPYAIRPHGPYASLHPGLHPGLLPNLQPNQP
ncbi:hypothetical protein NHX12_014349, partial [Muraenolepis orangiensis]